MRVYGLIMNNRYPVEELEKRIGWTFKNREYLVTALTHSSLMNERVVNITGDYERQEFLGDAVLELIVSDRIFRDNPDLDEGRLTSLRSSLVCERSLALSAKEIGLSEFILLGKGDDMQGSRYRDSIVSDVFEALIGGIYLDGGIDAARDFVDRMILNDYKNRAILTDSKTNLQTYAQKNGLSLTYELVSESGPDHDRVFVMAAVIDGKEAARGSGRSKKLAEQSAAYEAYKKIRE